MYNMCPITPIPDGGTGSGEAGQSQRRTGRGSREGRHLTSAGLLSGRAECESDTQSCQSVHIILYTCFNER